VSVSVGETPVGLTHESFEGWNHYNANPKKISWMVCTTPRAQIDRPSRHDTTAGPTWGWKRFRTHTPKGKLLG